MKNSEYDGVNTNIVRPSWNEPQTMPNNLLQPGPTHVLPLLTARLRKTVRQTLRAGFCFVINKLATEHHNTILLLNVKTHNHNEN